MTQPIFYVHSNYAGDGVLYARSNAIPSEHEEQLLSVDHVEHKNLNEDDIVESLFPPQLMSVCSKYESCNANICPLDRKWRLRDHLRGESSCHFLRLHVKGLASAEERDNPVYQAAAELWDKHRDELPPELAKQLERASSSNRKVVVVPPIKVDAERAAKALRQLEQIFGEADEPISRFN